MLPRNLYILLLAPLLLFGQGPMNGYGLGNIQTWRFPSQGGMTSLGLIPSFHKGVSLMNPSTWPQLKYTYLSIAYNGLESNLTNLNARNGFSSIQSGQLIVPIKQLSALGISIHPYTYQQVALSDTIYPDMLAFGDTLDIQRRYDQAGGIMALNFSAAMTVFKDARIGASLQLLFGSSRQHKKLFLDQIPITETSRMSYSGLNAELFLHRSFSRAFDIYIHLGIPIEPLDAIYTNLHPFDDTNKNAYHDYTYNFLNPGYDFPHPQDVPKAEQIRIKDIYEPASIAIGLSGLLTDRLQLSIETKNEKDFADYPIHFPIILNQRINNKHVTSVGLIWFSNDLSTQFSDKFSIRSGLTYKSYITDSWDADQNNRIENIDPITEVGGALGFGFKFKAVGNQIDVSYYYGIRIHPLTFVGDFGEERIQELQVGISLADLWFVRRRQR